MKKHRTILIYILFALLLAACQGASNANAPTLLTPDPTPVDSLPNEADLLPQDDVAVSPSPTPFSIPFSQFEDGGWRYLRDEQGLAYWHFPELPGIIFRNNGIRYEKTPSPAHMAPLPPIVKVRFYVEIYPRPERQSDNIRCGTSPFLASIHNEICTHFFRDIVVFSPGGAPLETKPCGGGGYDGFLEKDGFLATSEGLSVCLKAEDELPFARQEQGEILDWLIEFQTSEDLGLEGPIRLWVPLYYQTELGG